MVGYNPELKLTERDYVAASVISNVITRAVTQPFDVLKIRFQLQVEAIKKGNLSSKYQSIPQALTRIVQEESVRALWKGHVPAQVLSVGYGLVQFTAFEYMTRVAWFALPKKYAEEFRPLTHTVCGGLSAILATIAIHPLDVLRTRFVAQGEPKYYRSFYHAATHIRSAEGLTGFYRGLSPAVMGVAPQIGLQFGLYALLQNMWNKAFGTPQKHHPGPVESFICGTGSGFLSKLLIYPLDLLKKRLQIQGFEEARKTFGKFTVYNGFLHCFKGIIREEGLLGLYKGLSPSLLKAMAVSGTLLCVYDQICGLLSWRHTLLNPENGKNSKRR